MLLTNLLLNVEYTIKNNMDISNMDIAKIECDSKRITMGDIFVAIKGYQDDGNNYIEEAITKGARCIVIQNDVQVAENPNIVYVVVENTRRALAQMAINYFGNPASKLKMIGITGTKGKTTTAYMIRNILAESGKKVGMIGSIYITYGDKKFDSERTSPDALTLQKILYDMVRDGMQYCVMEVSSHALALDRVYGIKFMIGIFTNLSKDHLDFHPTFEDYFNAKASLFQNVDYALINSDDVYAPKLIKTLKCKHALYGLDNGSNLTAVDIRINNKYVEFKMYVNKMLRNLVVNMPGRFSVYNALAAIGTCSLLGCQIDAIERGLMTTVVPGRSEVVEINKPFTVMIDYAHNAASLESVILATKKYARGRVIVVFGCGGDRDKEKRPAMGEVAGKLADFTVITTDNPRTESPKKIIADIEAGIKPTKAIYKVVENRKEAIKFAMRIAWRNDIIILAGKGHETQQILKNKTIYFDERKIVKEIAEQMPDKETL